MNARARWNAYVNEGGRLTYRLWCQAVDLVLELEALGVDCGAVRLHLGWKR